MPAKLSTAVLSEMLSLEKDKEVLLKLLEGRRVADKKHAAEVANLFVSRVVAGVAVEPVASSDSVDAAAHALEMLGLSEKGENYFSPQDTERFAKNLLPTVFGESDDAPVFHSDMNAAMLSYLLEPSNNNFPQETKSALDSYLTSARVKVLLGRVQSGQLPTDASAQSLQALADEHNVVLGSKLVVPQGVARLGTNASFPDGASIADKAEIESQRYLLEVSAKTDALIALNSLMSQQDGWVNRTLVDKLKDKMEDALNGSGYRYPSESLFSETLSKIDDNGRVVNEMVRFSRPPLFGFKASFKDPKVPDEAYLATALRLRTEGVKFPYIKSTFKDPEAAKIFLDKSVGGLLAGGFDIDDISVSPNLKNFFIAYKNKYVESFSIESAPPASPELKRSDEVVLRDELRRMQSSPELAEALSLYEQLSSINEPLTFMLSKMKDEENPMKLTDFSDKQLISVLAKYPLINADAETWSTALKAGGLVPTTKDLVRDVGELFIKHIDKADPLLPSKLELGTNERARLLAARDLLFKVMPDKAAQLVRVFEYLDSEPSLNVEPASPKDDATLEPDASASLNANSGENLVPKTEAGVAPKVTKSSVPDIAKQPIPGSIRQPALDGSYQSEFDEVPNPMSTNVQMDDGYADYQQPDMGRPLDGYGNDFSMPEREMGDYGYDPSFAPVQDIDVGQYDNPQFYQQTEAFGGQGYDNGTLPQFDVDAASPLQLEAPIAKTVDGPVADARLYEPGDVVRPAYHLSKEKWGAVLGKTVHQFPVEIFEHISNLTPADEMHIQTLVAADGWNEIELAEVKNTIEGLCWVSNKHLTSTNEFTDREKELFSALPQSMVPVQLRAEHEMLQAQFSQPVETAPENLSALPVVDEPAAEQEPSVSQPLDLAVEPAAVEHSPDGAHESQPVKKNAQAPGPRFKM